MGGYCRPYPPSGALPRSLALAPHTGAGEVGPSSIYLAGNKAKGNNTVPTDICSPKLLPLLALPSSCIPFPRTLGQKFKNFENFILQKVLKFQIYLQSFLLIHPTYDIHEINLL